MEIAFVLNYGHKKPWMKMRISLFTNPRMSSILMCKSKVMNFKQTFSFCITRAFVICFSQKNNLKLKVVAAWNNNKLPRPNCVHTEEKLYSEIGHFKHLGAIFHEKFLAKIIWNNPSYITTSYLYSTTSNNNPLLYFLILDNVEFEVLD